MSEKKPLFGVLAGEPEIIGERCADGGKCHHRCTDTCWRRTSCAPLSGSGLLFDWSAPNPAEPAPAQDEREAIEVVAYLIRRQDDHNMRGVRLHVDRSCYDARTETLDLMTVAQHERIVAALTRPAQAEQQPAYVECRECTDCGHVGINDAHPTDATCAMCDWSGLSPVEDQCPDCGKENAMGAACPKCSGRYRILAETHVAAPIAQTEQQPVAHRLINAEGEVMTDWHDGAPPDNFIDICGVAMAGTRVELAFAAPIAQTAKGGE